jgi:hypothetical protein
VGGGVLPFLAFGHGLGEGVFSLLVKVAQYAVAGGQALVPPGAGVVSGLTGGVGFSARADGAQASVEGAEPGQPQFFPGVAGRSPWETAPRAEKAPGSVNGRRSLSHGAQRRSSA